MNYFSMNLFADQLLLVRGVVISVEYIYIYICGFFKHFSPIGVPAALRNPQKKVIPEKIGHVSIFFEHVFPILGHVSSIFGVGE